MAEVFISYSRKDIAFARLLHEALTQDKVETWIDWERIPVGEKWWDEISAAIAQSDIFLLIISSHSISSQVCKKEVEQALSYNKRIVPIIVDETPEAAIRDFMPELTTINWIIFQRDDMFILEERPDENLKPEEQVVALPKTPQFRQAVEKLNTAIHTDWTWVKAHTRLGTRAQEWERRKQDGSWLLRGKDLAEAEGWLAQSVVKKYPQPTDLQRQYVLASRKAESRRQKVTMGASLGALVLISILLVVAILARRSALINLAQSENLRMAAVADNILSQPDGNVETAALLSLRALQGGYLPQADTPLQNSMPYLFATHTFIGHTSSVDTVAFSPDGNYILTGSQDKTARMLDAVTGGVVHTFNGHSGSVESVAFSPDGKYVLTGSSDKTAKLWDAATGALVRTFSDPASTVVRTSVQMKRSNHSVAFSPDGIYVLTGSDDGNARLWNAATGELVITFSGHTNIIRSVAFSPDGKYVLTGGLDNTARLWNAATGDQVRSFQLATWVYSVAFSPDGKYILTWTSYATLWNASTGDQVRTFGEQANGAVSVAFSPDGKYLLSGSPGQQNAMLWEIANGALTRTFRGHTDTVSAVAFSPDGKYVLTGSLDSTAKMWDAFSNAGVRTFNGHTDIVENVAFSLDGKYVLTGSDDGTAKLWDAATYEVVRNFKGHTDAVWSVAFSPDGKYVLTGSLDKTARLWEIATGAQVRSFTGHTAAVWSVAFSPDGDQVLTGSYDHTAKLWDAATGAELHTFDGHTEGIIGVTFSPDGKHVLTGSIDWDTKLWDAATGAELITFKGASSVEGVAFSPDGKYVLTGNYERTATLWDAASGAVVRIFSGHTGSVGNVAFSPDGKYVLTASLDFTAKLWETATGIEVRTFGGHTGSVNGVAFSPDGKYVLTGSSDKTIQLWDTDHQDTIRWACAHLTRDLTQQERTQYFITSDSPTCSPADSAPVTPAATSSLATQVSESAAATMPQWFATTPVQIPLSPEHLTNLDVDISDSFSSNVNNWPTFKNASDNCSVSSLELQADALQWNLAAADGNSCYYIYYPEIAPVSDFDTSLDVKSSSGTDYPDYGLGFRIVDAENFYDFVFTDSNQKFSVGVIQNSDWIILQDWKFEPVINPGGINHLAVSARGNVFYFYINDKLVDTIEDSRIASGYIGIIAEVYNGGDVSVSFDNFLERGVK